MTLHSQQSHGVASLEQGWIEVMLDRKVMSDDFKGLGEGVFDNRPVVSNFIIQIENKKIQMPVRNFHYAFPSVVSSVLNDFLQQTVQTLFTTVRSDVFQSKFHPIKQSLSCDISITSLKNLVTSDLVYNGTSLIIHRKKMDCNFPEAGMLCTDSSSSPNLLSLFPDISVSKIRETTLTHLHPKNSIPVSGYIPLAPMELKSFQVKL